MTLTAGAIRGDLKGLFPEVFDDLAHRGFADDCVNIAMFLTNPSQVGNALDQLDRQMQARLAQNLGIRSQDLSLAHMGKAREHFDGSIARMNQKFRGEAVTKNLNFSKLLTTELSAMEQRYEFTLFQDERGHPKAEMIMPLKANQFRAQLADGRPFKDPTIGPDHGEYTHRLQWYAIAQAQVVADPADVYRRLGGVPWTHAVNRQTNPENFGLWDALVDRQPPGAPGLPSPFPFYKFSNLDFRCPEALLTWICQPFQQIRYPLLGTFLRARKEKRQFVQDNQRGDNLLLESYMALKLFNRRWEALSPNEREKVDEFIRGGQQAGVLHPKPGGPGYRQE